MADRLRLHRQARAEPIAVVEGPSDERLGRQVFEGRVDLFVAGTRAEVVNAVAQARKHGLDAIVGLVDRDFDDLVERAVADGLPLVAYDGADLEAALFLSPALDRLLLELGSREKLEESGGPAGVRESTIAMTAPVTRLRRKNAEENLGLVFDAVDIASRMKVQSPALEPAHYVDALIRVSSSPPGLRTRLISATDDSISLVCSDSGVPLFRGRDVLAVLGVLLRRQVGGCSQQQAHSEYLARILRLAANPEELRVMPWFSRVAETLDMVA